jgi:hypothetical protein
MYVVSLSSISKTLYFFQTQILKRTKNLRKNQQKSRKKRKWKNQKKSLYSTHKISEELSERVII